MPETIREQVAIRRATKSAPDSELAPGKVWAECLCTEISPEDTPCCVCYLRFSNCPEEKVGDDVTDALGAVHIITFITIKQREDNPYWEITAVKK